MRARQVPVVSVDIEKVVSSPYFILGWNDVRMNRSYHKDYDRWDTNQQWRYERGRIFAVCTQSKLMPVEKGTKKVPMEVVYKYAELKLYNYIL